MSKSIDINSSTYKEREDAAAAAFPEGTISEVGQKVQRKISNSGDLDPGGFSARPPLAMVPTGMPSIDHILGGGVSEGQSIGIGGMYGGGKSILLLQIASNLAAAGAAVLYATPELTPDEVFARQAARYADSVGSVAEGMDGRPDVPGFGEIRRMRGRDGESLSQPQRRVIKESLERWTEDVGPRFSLLRYKEGDSLEALIDGVDLFYELAHGDRLKVIVVDPIQRLAPMRQDGMSDIQFDSILKSEHERIALVATQIKDLTDEDRTVVLFGSDANAGVTDPNESASAGFRGGAKVGNAATTMFFISKPRPNENYGEFSERVIGERGYVLGGSPFLDENGAELDEVTMNKLGCAPVIISTFKNREGPGGYIGAHMRGAYSRFVDCAREIGLQADEPETPASNVVSITPQVESGGVLDSDDWDDTKPDFEF